MRAEDFHSWLAQASELTPSQRQQAIDWLSQERQPITKIGGPKIGRFERRLGVRPALLY